MGSKVNEWSQGQPQNRAQMGMQPQRMYQRPLLEQPTGKYSRPPMGLQQMDMSSDMMRMPGMAIKMLMTGMARYRRQMLFAMPPDIMIRPSMLFTRYDEGWVQAHINHLQK